MLGFWIRLEWLLAPHFFFSDFCSSRPSFIILCSSLSWDTQISSLSAYSCDRIILCFQTAIIMAAKIIANLIVMGSGIMIRAFAQAYRQALANASKNGVAQEAVQNTIRRASKAMTEQEARQILGITENSSWEEILKKYDVLFENNAKQGSFYLQSKVHRAKACLEAVYNPGKGQGTAT